MKTCREVHEDAGDLLEGRLPPASWLAVRLHLLFCTHCRRHLRHLRLLVQTLAIRGGATSPPDDFVSRVVGRLECTDQPPHLDDTNEASGGPRRTR